MCLNGVLHPVRTRVCLNGVLHPEVCLFCVFTVTGALNEDSNAAMATPLRHIISVTRRDRGGKSGGYPTRGEERKKNKQRARGKHAAGDIATFTPPPLHSKQNTSPPLLHPFL